MELEKRFTPPELARAWRVKPDTVRAWIRSGELEGINLAAPGKRDRYVVTPEAVEQFERRRSAAADPSTKPKKKRASKRKKKDENYHV